MHNAGNIWRLLVISTTLCWVYSWGWLAGWLVWCFVRGIWSITCYLDKIGCSLCWLVEILCKQTGCINSLLLVCVVQWCLWLGLYSPVFIRLFVFPRGGWERVGSLWWSCLRTATWCFNDTPWCSAPVSSLQTSQARRGETSLSFVVGLYPGTKTLVWDIKTLVF